ncbi:TIGR00266 family protein [Flavobacterium oreochromis]|uniref:TIGR00266 family protein n=2 Tax=Flavobacterium TaxID=237 RepID=A0A246GAW4_9FLAO|nr:TIGR00266 family protein [Flavobacterium oreochromis]OWP75573.1 TIGR00266 family protein [Flavobacterium oreochromis]OWP77412.1 TIGR00266 family protein [Flavobacterium oreochromis]POR26334.1 TIGR00266 family protein [Flavobacterium columnare]
MQAHEIDYHIYGEEMQYVEIELDPQEVVIAEAGGFMMMENGIKMETIFGDGSNNQGTGVLGKILSAGKRVLTGESMFMTAYQNQDFSKRKVSFASPYPGKIIAIDLMKYGGKFICQKDSFLCAAKGVSIGIEFSRKLGRGLFGGEGFIMQKIEGDGMAFIHSGGTLARKELQPGEILKIDTGCLVGFTKNVDYDIEFIGGIKNTLFGGEGMFYATLRGPGIVYIQSLPFSRLAGRVIAASNIGGQSKEEGSLLGGFGKLLDGDNGF